MELVSSNAQYAKQKLILAAIHLFGDRGVEAVSLRMINREGGHKNNSALHYHFGNKLGLIEAVNEFIQTHFDEVREPQLASLEQRAKQGGITLRDVVEVFVHPYVQIVEGYEWGSAAIRTIARMQFEDNEDVHRILSETAGDALQRFAKLTRAQLPDLTSKKFKLRYNFVVNFTVQGFADYQNLQRTYFGNLKPAKLSDLADFYVEMGVAALTAP
ncbi:MAG: TetR family transcriptional regulator [Pseudomonadota bacterium]